MADFRPETQVWLFKATGVDEENQPYFESEGAKLAWYNSHSPLTYTELSYQRENREYIRVHDKAEKLRDYDMMCFQNSDGRYVFCQIQEVEFINPNTTEITYTVDYMQSYIDVATFGKCWVEREMVIGDWDGSKPSWNNLQPEGLETGVLTRYTVPGANDGLLLTTSSYYTINVVSAYDKNGQPIISSGSISSALNVFSFNMPSQQSAFHDMMSLYASKNELLEGIACIFITPYDMGSSKQEVLTFTPNWNMVDNYEIVNAKCMSSEFCNFELGNRQGNTVTLKPEEFTETDTIDLYLEAHRGAGNGGAILYPRRYQTFPKSHGVIVPFNAQIAYAGNAFEGWLAQNAASMLVDVGMATARGVIGFENPMMLASSFAQMAGTAAKIVGNSYGPMSIGGQSSQSAFNWMISNIGFEFSLLAPTVANIKCIDEYFSRYGYRTNRFKVPNVNTRPKWNYVKTDGGVVRGPFPKKAQLYMQRLLDNGVTFWHLGGGEEITQDWPIEQNKE